MNATRGRHWMVSLLLAVLALGATVWGEDAPAPSPSAITTNGAVAFTLSPPKPPAAQETEPVSPSVTAEAVVAPAEVLVPAEEAAPVVPVEQVPSPGYATDFGLETSDGAAKDEDAEAQRRLQAPSPEQIIAEYGAVGFLFRQPEPRNFLELINPFAPEEFGPGEREVYNRDPNLRPGATLPRTFINDITHEPVMNFWNWAW